MNKIFKKLKTHFERMNHVRKIHGLRVVGALYVGRIPFLHKAVQAISGRFLVKTKILGSNMYLDPADRGLHRKLLLKGIREIEHSNQLRENIKPGMLGIEIGANVGYFALIGARAVGETGKIYCIEPEPQNVRLLMKNISANDFENRTEVFQYLVGDHEGMEKLYLSRYANVHSLSPTKNDRGFVEVPMITLDKFLEQNELEPEDVDFIRMDIEGYEVMAFQGMKKLFSSKRPLKIFMEFHPSYYPEWGWTFEKLLRYLDSLGFKIKEIAKGKNYDNEGAEPLILKNPSVDEVVEMQRTTKGDGSQAYLERA